MPRVGKNQKLEFEGEPTIEEAIEALEDARASFGGKARIRVGGSLKDFDITKGSWLAYFFIEPALNRAERRAQR
jgi:hypothetical protein